jgi:hypothetical protein
MIVPQDPDMLLDLSSPDAWMLPVPDQCVQVGDHNDAATTNADTPVSDVDSPLAQHLSLAQGQTMPTPYDAAATGPAACMHTIDDDYSIEMEDVDEFMEDVDEFMESVLEDDQMKPFMGTDRLDTPLYQYVTEDVTESHGSQEDLDWYTHSQSTGIITSMDDRKVSASSQATTPQRSLQAKSSIETVTVPATIRLITVPNANSVGPLQSQEQQASPHDLNPHDGAMTAFSSLSSATMLQHPMVCKPLTAYNYFYRVERDNIVNGMTSATDPLPPVDLGIGREKQEKLLQQHW